MNLEGNQELINKYIMDCEVRGLAKLTIKNFGIRMRTFNDFVNKDFMKVDVEDLKRFLIHLREKELAPETIRGYYSALNSFYDYLEMEDLMDRNMVPKFRKRYLTQYLKNQDGKELRRQIISVGQMRDLLSMVLDIRDRCVMTLLAKTGARVSEISNIDVGDINWKNNSIVLKKNGKRSNCVVFFDSEAQGVLRRWLKTRASMVDEEIEPLFIAYDNHERLLARGIESMVVKYASRAGIHKKGGRLDERFTPHNFRHWFTTHLRRKGMPRDFIKLLRGDSMKETMDIYYHIDLEEVRESYLRCVPRLMV